MTKECKKARNAVLIPLVVLVGLLMLCSSCGTQYSGCGAVDGGLASKCSGRR